MAIPLAGIAIGAGLVRAGAGVFSAGKNARKSRDLIKRAYQLKKREQERSQGYTRQQVNESLNARGVLNPGAAGGMPKSGPIADAYAAGAPVAPAKDVLGLLRQKNASVEGSNQRRMAVSATAGQAGQANTLSGQVNSDLSSEFFDEQQDLWHEREAGINGTKAQQASDTLGAIGSGIDLGTSIYSAGKMLGYGAAKAPAPTGGAAPRSAPQVTIKGAFGIDPVDPLGLSKQSLSNFDFNVGGN